MPEVASAGAAPAPVATGRIAWRHRLYLRIYLAVLASLLLSVLLFTWLAQRHNEALRMFPNLDAFAAFAANSLPAPERSEAEQAQVLLRLQELVHADLALYRSNGVLQAAVGGDVPKPPVNWDWQAQRGGWLPGMPPRFALHLPDGRWLFGQHFGPPGFLQSPGGNRGPGRWGGHGEQHGPGNPPGSSPGNGPADTAGAVMPSAPRAPDGPGQSARMPPPFAPQGAGSAPSPFAGDGPGPGFGERHPHERRSRFGPPARNLFWILLITALVIGLGAYPVVRRLTGRLERLQRSVLTWGSGRLSTRVAVEGKDEVAALAHSFNQAADQIEALVAAQKSLLANASHELRSPLARIRMALELGQGSANQEELRRNVHELDQLIEEILLSSRLDAVGEQALAREEIDLLGLLAEECARVDAELQLDGEAPAFTGDARLLRRMLRNLLENARRYGQPSNPQPDEAAAAAICATLSTQPEVIQIDICDRGPGVPESEREQIFVPFYRVKGASEAAGGVGLGLALVRQIVLRHGGSVQCLERSGGGSCFRIRLPRQSA